MKGVLFLNLKDDPYSKFLLGDKYIEYRRDSDWIRKRMFDNVGNQKVEYLVIRKRYKKVTGKDIMYNIISIKYDAAIKEWKIQVDTDTKRFITYPDDLLARAS